MANDVELKPCPFCGGKANIYTHKDFVFIRCQVCDCGTPSISASIEYCATERAVRLWDRRADNE